jgi:hypothetical protein
MTRRAAHNFVPGKIKREKWPRIAPDKERQEQRHRFVPSKGA